MLSKKMEKALNAQINLEMFSAYTYLSMAAFFAEKNLDGFSNWMRLQFTEELQHAGKLFDYLIDRDAQVTLSPIKAPAKTWQNIAAAVQAAYKAEVANTTQINDIMDLAFKERDHATRVMLQWFIEEQVEEEASALKIVQQVKLAGKDPSAIMLLDRELGARQLAPETDPAA